MIRVHRLTKCFENAGQSVLAVNQVSFDVRPSEVFGLLGPNGAGKTTTLRMILGLLQPDSGFAEIQGFRTDRDREAVKRSIGLVSANDGVYPWLTAKELLLFFADLYGVPPKIAKQRLEELVDHFGLASFLQRRCSTLSTGQKQRVLFARGLIHDPPALMLDEPTRGLDVVGTQRVFEYLNYLRERQKVVIISTHRLDEAQRFCDRFGLLFEGELKYCGPLEELIESTQQHSLVDMFVAMMSPSPPETSPVGEIDHE
jgi:sodium transport system ATP-binding protein